MNILVITEGPGDKEIYRHWIPTLNPNLSFVDNLQQIQSDNFSIIQGQGNPNYFDIIDSEVDPILRTGEGSS